MRYLDHAATTPMRPSAIEAYTQAASRVGNPSSLHSAGRAARAVVENAREAVAAALGAHPTEVVFTSGATESNNLAIKGWALGGGGHLVTTAIEHHATLDPARWVERLGASVSEIRLHGNGLIDRDSLADTLATASTNTAVAIHHVNNEIGTVQPLEQIANAVREAGAFLHIDAAQAPGHVPVNFAASGASTMAVSGHKVGGPMGIGALLVRRDVQLVPVAHGGGQQRFRSGTMDTAGIAAFAAALTEAVADQPREARRLAELRGALIDRVAAAIPDARLSGPGMDPSAASPHIVHWVFPGADAEAVLFGLDQEGIAASSGSACTAGVVDASHVLLALGASDKEASQTLRLSLGWNTTADDVDHATSVLPAVVERARAAAS